MITVEELKCLLELEAPCSGHSKIKVLGSTVSILEDLEKLSKVACYTLTQVVEMPPAFCVLLLYRVWYEIPHFLMPQPLPWLMYSVQLTHHCVCFLDF